MRKLNGITINGEYLGNSVVINGMFRAICTISPVIMRDFILIINKIDRLEEAVKIHNFNCGFDCIDIEFENKTSKGMASLYFKLHDGEPLLKDCKLVIDNEEYSTFQEKIKLRSKKDVTNPNKTTTPTQNSELDRLQKIRELREKKQAMQKQQNGNNTAGVTGKPSVSVPPQRPSAPPDRALTPEQQRDKKRQELLEKKRKLLEAKKAKTNDSLQGEVAEQSSTDSINEDTTDSVADTKTENQNNSTVDAKKAETKTQADSTTEKTQSANTSGADEPVSKPTIVVQDDGTITNENGQQVVKEERVNPDGTVSEVYVNPENPEEVYEQNENGEFVNNNITQDIPTSDIGEDEQIEEDNYVDNEVSTQESSLLENLSDEDLENMTDEELAALEAELNAELGEDTTGYDNYSDYNNYSDTGYQNSGYGMPDFTSFADKLAQGLTEGLTQGLSQGLAQGLAQGFGFTGQGGFGNAGGGFGNTGGGFAPQSDFGDSFGDSFGSNSGQEFATPQVQQIMPDFNQIDSLNSSASESAKDSYAYDESSSLDDISDFYSDFYEEAQIQNVQGISLGGEQKSGNADDGEGEASEIDALKAELEALKAQAGEQKELMSVDEFLARQQELKEAKEKLSRQKMKIVGSNGRVSASALDGGVFAAGKKLYKWGDTRVLDE